MSHPNADSTADFVDFTWTIIVAGGSGLRFGGRKQFADLAGRSVLQRSVDAAATVSGGLVIVVPKDTVDTTTVDGGRAAVVVVAGGSSRAESVRAGLAAVGDDARIVLVHDAARPLATPALFRSVVTSVADGAKAVVPAISVSDTIRKRDGGVLDRSQLLAVQTPQGFDVATLREAHAQKGEATDDATLVEALGHEVEVVAGEASNNKVTEPTDLVTASELIRYLAGEPMTQAHSPTPSMRVGQGFDIHPFATNPDRPLVLGGVTFDGAIGLAGHSDADVIAHAITDAVLGAAGLGDIGSHFPDTDPALAGADSIELLRSAAASVRAAGFEPQNADCSVVLDAPKLAPKRDEMQQRLSNALGAPVTVKGKRSEGVGALGRQEGIACWATALLLSTGNITGESIDG